MWLIDKWELIDKLQDLKKTFEMAIEQCHEREADVPYSFGTNIGMIESIMNIVAEMHTADPHISKYGEWKHVSTTRGEKLRCMACGHYIDLGVCELNYCPRCGAKNILK